MAHIFHLATCTTCQRILKELQPGPGIGMQDIKTESNKPWPQPKRP